MQRMLQSHFNFQRNSGTRTASSVSGIGGLGAHWGSEVGFQS